MFNRCSAVYLLRFILFRFVLFITAVVYRLPLVRFPLIWYGIVHVLFGLPHNAPVHMLIACSLLFDSFITAGLQT